MSNNGKGSSRRGTSKEEMKRFESNYDAIFRGKPKEIEEKEKIIGLCIECFAKATWIRRTQFCGDHPYCNQHAKLEKDFGKKDQDGYSFWQEI